MGLDGGEDRPKAADVEKVLAEFDLRSPALKSLCSKTKDLIEEFLQNSDVPFQSVQARVKARKKLKEKYLDPEKEYKQLDDITDLAGLRVITYYPDEVDRVAEVIEKEFGIDRENSVDKRRIDLDRFGYSAINYICEHLGTRTSLGEYKKFAGLRFEVQVTSILSHAWSEMNHGSYDLGESSPPEVRRRFFQLKALLELAESQFIELRDKTANYARAVAIQVETKVTELPLDASSLKSLIDQEPLIRKLDQDMADVLGVQVSAPAKSNSFELWSRGAQRAGLTTVEALRNSLTQYDVGIVEFVRRCREYWGYGSKTYWARGLSVFQLAKLLIRNRGEAEALAFAQELKLSSSANRDLAEQVAIAREIVKKYSTRAA
jgi:ppGpp synthetase/RelA/SpoT-type nucleotidyltranferase